jgi:hypothetical protein
MVTVKIGLIFKEKTNEMLQLQLSFVQCCRRMEKISSANHVKGKKYYTLVKDEGIAYVK